MVLGGLDPNVRLPPSVWIWQNKYFKSMAHGGPPDAKAIAELRSRYDTDQLSVLKTSER